MNFLDLCAGIGGFSLGLEAAGMTCAGQVEIDPFCIKVLEKHWPHVPRWKDLTDERKDHEYPAVGLVCGGYPCQPFSTAGKRRGKEDDRHLWPHVFRIVQRLRPDWCLFENVAGHVSLGLDEVLADLEGAGYAAGTLVIPACAVDAPHRRDRVWIIANASGVPYVGNSGGALRQRTGRSAGAGRENLRCAQRPNAANITPADGEALPDPDSAGLEECIPAAVAEGTGFGAGLPHSFWGDGRQGWGGAQLGVGGGTYGLPAWMDEHLIPRVAMKVPYNGRRLKALGNAVVPPLVTAVGLAIVGTDNTQQERDDGRHV